MYANISVCYLKINNQLIKLYSSPMTNRKEQRFTNCYVSIQ